MRRAVIWLGIILAALLACGPLVAGPPYAGATAEQYDWQGTWESSYKKEITGPSFPWAFTRIKDAFQANFSFSMDASGKVRGEAHGSIFYRFEYDGCASISQNSCVTRCKGEGVVEGNTGERGFPIPPHPGIYPRYVPDMSFGEYAAIPVTGQLNGTTVHLKLGPPDYLVPFDTTSTCVGPMGTQTNTTTMSWFCPAGSYLCAPSAMFLEIDMPLAHEAAQPIHAAEVGGGLDGMVGFATHAGAPVTASAASSTSAPTRRCSIRNPQRTRRMSVERRGAPGSFSRICCRRTGCVGTTSRCPAETQDGSPQAMFPAYALRHIRRENRYDSRIPGWGMSTPPRQ